MLSLIEKDDSADVDNPDNIVILRHDFENDKFTQINSEMSVSRNGCAAVVINNNNNNNNPQQEQRNQVLVFGGHYPVTDIVESCTIKNNSNQQHQQWRQLGRRMPMPLRGLTAINLKDNYHNEKVYLFGGYNRNHEVQNRCYEYDNTSDTYKNMPSMKTKRFFLTSVTIKNKFLFAIGGRDEYHYILDTVEYFAITSAKKNAKWRILKAKMNKKRCYCCSASVGDIFYVFGGVDENNIELHSIEMYDTSKKNSKFVLLDAKIKTACFGACTVVLGYHILIIGGLDKDLHELNSIEIFNTKTKEFVDSSKYAFPTMTASRSYFAAALVDNDGGNNNNDTVGMDTYGKKIVVVGDYIGARTAEVIDIKTTAIPISKFCFTRSTADNDDGKLPPDINQIILSFLIAPETKNNS